MNRRRARELRRALSPQAAAAVKRFEAQRADETRALRLQHNVRVGQLEMELRRDLAEVRERYAQRIEAVKRGDRSGIEVAVEVPA